MYDEKQHAPAVTATITSCYLPAHAYAANHPQSIYIPRLLPFVNALEILTTSFSRRAKQRKWMRN